MGKKIVHLNSKVTIDNEKTRRSFVLVKTDEIDINSNKISINSPLGKALLNHSQNESIIVKTPIGEKKFTIVDIS